MKVLVAQSCPVVCNSMDCRPPGSSVHGFFPGKNTRVSSHYLLQGTRGPTQVSTMKANSLLSEPPEKPLSTQTSFSNVCNVDNPEMSWTRQGVSTGGRLPVSHKALRGGIAFQGSQSSSQFIRLKCCPGADSDPLSLRWTHVKLRLEYLP